jgi:hypothetical protein
MIGQGHNSGGLNRISTSVTDNAALTPEPAPRHPDPIDVDQRAASLMLIMLGTRSTPADAPDQPPIANPAAPRTRGWWAALRAWFRSIKP